MFMLAWIDSPYLWGGLFVLLLALVSAGRTCGNCSHKLPVFRRPDGWSQLWWGGWTCTGCGTRCDRKGNPTPSESRGAPRP
jgi:hypothetical protein